MDIDNIERLARAAKVEDNEKLPYGLDAFTILELCKEIKLLDAKIYNTEKSLNRIISETNSWGIAEQTMDCRHTYASIRSIAIEALFNIKNVK